MEVKVFYIRVAFLSVVFPKVTAGKAEIYNTQSFELIRSSSYPHFVMFYAPWCGHCKRMQPLWDNYADESFKSRRLKVAKIDCTDNTPLCATENIKAYPTLRLYANQEKYTYRGYRNVVAFREFVNEKVQNIKDGQVPPSTPEKTEKENPEPIEDNTPVKAKMLSEVEFYEETEQGYTFVDFYAPWCPHCRSLEPVWDKLATRYKHDKRITIAKVDCTAEPDLCKKEMINAYPTLNLYKKGTMTNQFNGRRELQELVEFLEMFASDPETEVFRDPIIDWEPPTISAGELRFRLKTRPQLVYFHNKGITTSTEKKIVFESAVKEIIDWTENIEGVFIDCEKSKDFCGEINVTVFPTIIYFKTITRRYRYNGKLAPMDIVRFARTLEETDMDDDFSDMIKDEL